MDYGRLNRKELQALCKEHGIPANKTNVFMAEALGALLNGSKESEEALEPIQDPAEVVKSRANLKRAARSKKAAEPLLQASEVDDLASEFAKSSLDVVRPEDSDSGAILETAAVDVDEALTMVIDPPELSREPDIVAEPAKVLRKARTQSAKAKTKSLSSLVDAAPALVEPTLEVVLPVENSIDPLTTAEAELSRCFTRRVLKVIERKQTGTDTVELKSATLESIVPSEEDTLSPIVSPPAEIEDEETAGSAISKKVKAKRKKSKKVKPVSTTNVDFLEDGISAPTTDSKSGTASEIPESPTLGLTSDVITAQEIQREASMSPAPGDEAFEFHPVPESFAEIMTPGHPLVEATKECHHRVSRRTGKGCKSCASIKTVVSLTQEVLQAIEVPKVQTLPLVEDTEVHTTPVKQGDDKENALKNIDLHSLSIRKLQKEVKRGLSKRNNSKVKV